MTHNPTNTAAEPQPHAENLPAPPPALSFRDVTHAFTRAQVAGGTGGCRADLPVLDAISLDLAPGEIASVIGRSGCGKSTLLNLAAGLIDPRQGQVLSYGEPVTGPDSSRAVMFQQDALFPWLKVRENVAFGPRCHGWKDCEREIDEIIALVGLTEFADYYPAQLSGGMRQRAALARALVSKAGILLLDEPFASLDALTREAMQDLILDIHRRLHCAILLVTHDIDEAIYLSDRVALLGAGDCGATITKVTPTGLPRPRMAEIRDSPELLHLRHTLREQL